MTAQPPGNDDAQIGSTDLRIAMLEARVERLETVIAEALSFAASTAACDAPEAGADWSVDGYPYLPRGKIVGTDGGIDPQGFLASGWWGMEEWGAWGRDGQHSIRFHMPDYAGGYVDVRLVLRSIVPLGYDRPDLDITCNGYFLGRFSMSGKEQALMLRLPPTSIDGRNVILHLQHSQPLNPTSIGLGQDDRALGVGFVAMMIP